MKPGQKLPPEFMELLEVVSECADWNTTMAEMHRLMAANPNGKYGIVPCEDGGFAVVKIK